MSHHDVAIIGAGIAGASLAAEIAHARRVIVIEGEDHPGYHATGRSAAFWSETYGGPMIQPLSSASGPFLRDPPADMGGEGFLSPRGELLIAQRGDDRVLDGIAAEFAASGVALDRVAAGRFVNGLRPEWTGAIWGPTCADIDVARLHAAYLAKARRGGVVIACGDALAGAVWRGDHWTLTLASGVTVAAAVLVDAAGAWADPVAVMAGVAPIGIRPFRRTMVQLRTDPPAPADLPLVVDARGSFYFKGEAGGRLWLSPHDEIATDPCDAQPEEIDIAIAIDRLEHVVDWRVVAVDRTWAGLRSFAPDRLPVYGFDRGQPGFFWFAGQGGFGIQTAPAAARLAAALLLGTAPDPMVANIDPAVYSPLRFD